MVILQGNKKDTVASSSEGNLATEISEINNQKPLLTVIETKKEEVVRPKTIDFYLSKAFRFIYNFVFNAVHFDWMAAPIALLAALPSSVISALIIVYTAPAIEAWIGEDNRAISISVISFLSTFLGFAGYLFFYWAGMLWKERRDLFDSNGNFIVKAFKEKLRVIKIDFIIHLPGNIWVFLGIGAVQGGLLATNSSNIFWSVVLSQTSADIWYAFKEPFYWRAAKDIAKITKNTKVFSSEINEATGVMEEGVVQKGLVG